MVDNWFDCPHCGRNVISYPDECRSCGKDLRFLPDGRPNPGRSNEALKAFQFVGGFETWMVVLAIVAGAVLLALRLLD